MGYLGRTTDVQLYRGFLAILEKKLLFSDMSEQIFGIQREVGSSPNILAGSPKFTSEHFYRPSNVTSSPIFGGPVQPQASLLRNPRTILGCGKVRMCMSQPVVMIDHRGCLGKAIIIGPEVWRIN
jgi:hypothetical protein